MHKIELSDLTHKSLSRRMTHRAPLRAFISKDRSTSDQTAGWLNRRVAWPAVAAQPVILLKVENVANVVLLAFDLAPAAQNSWRNKVAVGAASSLAIPTASYSS
ncbi:hypothetical protein [Bradyrhizobium sp. BR 1432]|uniref:hypothetical protein n=1 Tax=Bradyrhizobium sp. BR 1432 TaxID=3447966 RepID=UPI003EE5054D